MVNTIAGGFSKLFIRVHRIALVATAHVRSLEKSEDGHFHVYMHGRNDPVEVSRRMVADVRAYLRNAR